MRYDRKFFEYLENLKRYLQVQPLILGGIAGSGGGAGGTPGGFIGYLPQTRVAYDYTEAESEDTPASGISLLHNLNHIRYRLQEVESGSGGHIIAYSGIDMEQRGRLEFMGDVAVTDREAEDTTRITVAGGAGGGGWSPDPGVFAWDDGDDRFEFGDDVLMDTSHRIYFYDTDAYIYTPDAYDLHIGAYENIILKLDHTLVIGDGAAATDYAIKFDGETNDGLITWMEDENYFSLNNGDIIIGVDKLRIGNDPNAIYALEIAKGATVGFALRNYSTGSGGPLIVLSKSKNATIGTKTVTIDGTVLGQIDVEGVNTGSSFDYGSRIKFIQDGDAGASSCPTKITFETCPGEPGTIYTALTIGKEGDIIIGGGNANKDYTLTFDGETYDGIITWFESQNFFHFANDIMIANGKNLIFDTSTGTKIGTSTTQKLGFYNATPIVQPLEITDELTTITHSGPGTPNYAIQDLITVSGYGFATKDEGNTVLSVVANLQARVNELETRLVNLGLIADAD
jgi:hypothetical protein